MRKVLGSVLILTGCAAAGYLLCAARRRRLQCLEALAAAVTAMEAELAGRAAPIPELAATLSERFDGPAGAFFRLLLSKLDRLGETPLYKLWSEAVRETLTDLTPDERAALCELGASLGRYPLDMQRQALALCRNALSDAAAAARRKEAEERRLIWAFSTASGVLLLILLL